MLGANKTELAGHPSLIGRLIRWQLIAMAATLLIIVGWLSYSMTVYESGDLDRRMRNFAQILAETAAGSQNDPQATERRLLAVEDVFTKGVIEKLNNVDSANYAEALAAAEAKYYTPTYQVFDANGKVLFRSRNAPTQPITLQLGYADTQINAVNYRTLRTQSADGSVSVAIAESALMRRETMFPLIARIAASQVLMFLLCIFVLWWIARISFKPIVALAENLRQRRAGDLVPLDNTKTYSEVVPLVAALNDLLERESRRLDIERGFLADAAHELRTPMAAMSAQAHLLLQAHDDGTRTHAALQLQTGLKRVSNLLSQLLTIARVDASDAFSKVERIDAAELLRQRVAEHVPQARQKAITLDLDAPDNLALVVSPTGFTSIIDNLLDNAIRYTPSGGAVSISLHQGLQANSGCTLSVKDSGPGIDVQFRERVFERFYRIPGTEASGSGLGLAIVQKVAAAHGGSISLHDGLEGSGLGITLQLPPTHLRS